MDENMDEGCDSISHPSLALALGRDGRVKFCDTYSLGGGGDDIIFGVVIF